MKANKKILVFGITVLDYISYTKEFPNAGETILSDDFYIELGGKGLNQALTINKLGGKVDFVSCVGNDDNAKFIDKKFNDFGMKSNNLILKEAYSGISLVTVSSSGENKIVVNQNCNALISKEDIESKTELIKNSDLVIIQYELPEIILEQIFEICKNNNVDVLVNPAPALLNENLITGAKFFIPNEHEFELLSGLSQISETSFNHKLLAFRKKYQIENLIVTCGKNGVIWVADDYIKTFQGNPVKAIDTVGAGDCFVGSFSTKYVETNDIAKSIKFANAAAALSVTRKGGSASIPTIDEVEGFIYE